MIFSEKRVGIWLVIAAAMMFAVTVACSENDSEASNPDTAVRNIGQAQSTAIGIELSVSGYLFVAKDGQARLCEMLLESSPPQCGGDRIPLFGFDVDSTPNIQRVQESSEINTTAWTNEVVTITGTRISDGLVDVTLAGN